MVLSCTRFLLHISRSEVSGALFVPRSCVTTLLHATASVSDSMSGCSDTPGRLSGSRTQPEPTLPHTRTESEAFITHFIAAFICSMKSLNETVSNRVTTVMSHVHSLFHTAVMENFPIIFSPFCTNISHYL